MQSTQGCKPACRTRQGAATLQRHGHGVAEVQHARPGEATVRKQQRAPRRPPRPPPPPAASAAASARRFRRRRTGGCMPWHTF